MKTLNRAANSHKLREIIKEEITKFLSEIDLNIFQTGKPEDGKVDNITEFGTQLIELGRLIRAGQILNLDKTEISELSQLVNNLITKSSDTSLGAAIQRISKYSDSQIPKMKSTRDTSSTLDSEKKSRFNK